VRRLPLLVGIVLAAVSCDLGNDSGRVLPFRTIAKGSDSRIEAQEPRVVVIRDQDTWQALWTEHTAHPILAARKPLPEVDFSGMQVIAIFQTGDAVAALEILEIKVDEQKLDLRVLRPRAAENCQLPAELSNYYQVVTTKATPEHLDVRVELDQPTHHCRQ
jgi:hypothetical protein